MMKSEHKNLVAAWRTAFHAHCQQWADYWNDELESEALRIVTQVMQSAPLSLQPWKSPLNPIWLK